MKRITTYVLRIFAGYPAVHVWRPAEGDLADTAIAPGDAVDILLPDTVSLIRTTAIPRRGRRRFREVATLDVMASVPFERTEIYLVHRLEMNEAGAPIARTWLVPRDRVEPEISQATSHDAFLKSVRIESAGEAPSPPIINNTASLLASCRPVALANMGLSLVLCAAIGWSLTAEQRAARTQNILSEERLDAARTRIVDLRSENARLARERAEIETLAGSISDAVDLSGILNELTLSLPDTVWLSELNADTATLTTTGVTSGSVPDMILGLQNLETLRNVELSGAVTFDAGADGQRFELRGIPTGSAR